jgi:pyrimidine-nucleoside phosphorylase/thymidine phosphorylase
VRAVDIIRRKRHRAELDRDEIAFLISGFTKGTIPDYQVAAFLMAVTLAGMTEQETLALTEEMLESGSVLDLSEFPNEKVDKHSTGGVGDKTSLIIAPLAAAAGLLVPMISGRGLAHSGGTLDKLESIPGFSVQLSLSMFREVLRKAGCALIGQTDEIAPADRKLYALRDVTGTVVSIPLIVASILSKKLAEGITGLVLDVKVGSGAFMKDENSATELGTLLTAVPRRMGKQSVALVTDMNQPLGTHVGNALEVKESVEVLRGDGPNDLRELCLLLTAYMLVFGGVVSGVEEGKKKAAELIASGAGLEKLIEIVELQGGDPRVIEDPEKLPRASKTKPVVAGRGGYLGRIDTEAVGVAAMLLGAGRETVEATIDPAVGLVVERRIGDPVSAGDPLLTLHYNDSSRLDEVERLLTGAYHIQDQPPAPIPLVHKVLDPTEDN